MPSPREGRATRSRGSEDEFVLFLQGIPSQCRWQELKDLVRQTALHIRQAVVYDDQNGFPTGLGQIIVKNEDEAWRTYQRLSTNGWYGQSLVVTLARTSMPTQPIAGPTKSPSACMMPSSFVSGYTTPPQAPQNLAIPSSPMTPEPPMPPSPPYSGSEYVPMMSPMGMQPSFSPHQRHHSQPFIPIFADPLVHTMHQGGIPPSPILSVHQPNIFVDQPLPYPPILPYPPHHHHHHHHHPHGPSPLQPLQDAQLNSIHMNGRPPPPGYPHKAGLYHSHASSSPPTSLCPPRRTVLVQNLSLDAKASELEDFFADAGTIDRCHIPTDPTTGRPRGYAKITLRTADEAKGAAALYNNTFFMGLKLRVRVDRSNATIAEPFSGFPLHWRAKTHLPLPHPHPHHAHAYSYSYSYAPGPFWSDLPEANGIPLHQIDPSVEITSSPSQKDIPSSSSSASSASSCGDPPSLRQPLVVNGSGVAADKGGGVVNDPV
ncbi:hypothetical protein ASPZODRAFT_64465 [Penicilliopsis zonata CBS 506.65]|uniref:RRM domain-containing protein n=1 Tax=Penicilliopsis zonata CBS 506.65 TaxID=1073090 RepID=A0A1L9SL39_9EURO|nr:hypothetical protein ASPZODRAFT_64465 [Penicilliopsis zonata CBS 506.65]OJJ47905.1 hypothetical protein ASPZODRAFT_64465 [Penicilliopsis zonata CBS 506.65]